MHNEIQYYNFENKKPYDRHVASGGGGRKGPLTFYQQTLFLYLFIGKLNFEMFFPFFESKYFFGKIMKTLLPPIWWLVANKFLGFKITDEPALSQLSNLLRAWTMNQKEWKTNMYMTLKFTNKIFKWSFLYNMILKKCLCMTWSHIPFISLIILKSA